MAALVSGASSAHTFSTEEENKARYCFYIAHSKKYIYIYNNKQKVTWHDTKYATQKKKNVTVPFPSQILDRPSLRPKTKQDN